MLEQDTNAYAVLPESQGAAIGRRRNRHSPRLALGAVPRTRGAASDGPGGMEDDLAAKLRVLEAR